MKKLFILSAATLFLFSMNSCNDKETYSELQRAETKTINTFIDNHDIQVVSTWPDVWEDNVYYKTSSGLYFHLVAEGDTTVTINTTSKTRVGFRIIEYILDEDKTVITGNWDARDYPYPYTMVFGDSYSYTTYGQGLYETIGHMKNLGSEAKVIIPSSLNTSEYSNNLIPRAYDIKITYIE